MIAHSYSNTTDNNVHQITSNSQMLSIQGDTTMVCKDMLSRFLHSAGDGQAPSESFLTPRLSHWSQQGSRKKNVYLRFI